MPLGVVTDRSKLFIERNGWSIPFQNLKIDTSAASIACDHSQAAQHCFSDAFALKFGRDVDVLEIHPALASKRCIVLIKQRISGETAIVICHQAVNECLVSEHRVRKAF